MKITDIVPGVEDYVGVIEQLKRRSGKAADMLKVNKALDPKQHDINDTILHPDRKIYKLDKSGKPLTAPINPYAPAKSLPGLGGNQAPAAAGAGTPIFDRWEKMNRIALALQKLIIKRSVSFSVGNPILRNYTGNIDDDYKAAIAALERVLKENFEVSLNKQVAKSLYGCTEVAEYWFCQDRPKDSNIYGFSTKKEVKCMVFSPMDGMKIYPKRDLYNKLICLSREFSIQFGIETISYFEAITDEEIVLFVNKNQGSGWERTITPHPYGILPANYASQDETDYDDVNWIIDRLEYLLSKWGEVNNYNMGPTRFITGKIESWGQQKGDANALVQGDEGSKMEIVSWDHAPQSVKDEIEALLKFIFTLTQTPDISFDNLKSIGTISGVALKLLFTDAHLKVADKADILLPYFKQRDKIICAILANLNSPKAAAYENADIEHALDPFMVADEKEQVEITLLKNGNQAFESQERSVTDWGGDKTELDRIRAEEKVRNTASITEPTE